jgi:hypothetical protein
MSKAPPDAEPAPQDAGAPPTEVDREPVVEPELSEQQFEAYIQQRSSEYGKLTVDQQNWVDAALHDAGLTWAELEPKHKAQLDEIMDQVPF